MGTMTSQITSFTIVYSTVYSDADQRKHQSSASLAFARGIHRGPVNSPHKCPVTRKMFPFDDVIMKLPRTSCCFSLLHSVCQIHKGCCRKINIDNAITNETRTYMYLYCPYNAVSYKIFPHNKTKSWLTNDLNDGSVQDCSNPSMCCFWIWDQECVFTKVSFCLVRAIRWVLKLNSRCELIGTFVNNSNFVENTTVS